MKVCYAVKRRVGRGALSRLVGFCFLTPITSTVTERQSRSWLEIKITSCSHIKRSFSEWRLNIHNTNVTFKSFVNSKDFSQHSVTSIHRHRHSKLCWRPLKMQQDIISWRNAIFRHDRDSPKHAVSVVAAADASSRLSLHGHARKITKYSNYYNFYFCIA